MGEGLYTSYLAELSVEKANASQHSADPVLVISYRDGDEGNLNFHDVTILDQLWSDILEPIV